jgi:hypothetical protein
MRLTAISLSLFLSTGCSDSPLGTIHPQRTPSCAERILRQLPRVPPVAPLATQTPSCWLYSDYVRLRILARKG